MQLVDFSQVIISNLMMQLSNTDNKLEEGMIRHMIIASLLGYRKKFAKDYGDLVICCDDHNYWRRDIFPQYKASRKKDREESEIDWNEVFSILNRIRDEIKINLPYRTLQVDRAEADDIIGALCNKCGSTNPNDLVDPILIVSGDKDFVQLQKYHNVAQYSPVQKKMITIDNPERFLREHIMLGDKGDGIPNFLSGDNTFVDNKRQTPINKKKMAEWAVMQPQAFCNEHMLRGYTRNELLVNLDKIPQELQDQIWNAFENTDIPSKSGVLRYLMSKRLRVLTERLNDF